MTAPPPGRLPPCPSRPNCVCSQDQGAAAIAPLDFRGDSHAAFADLRAVLEALPRTRIVTANGPWLAAECRTMLFRFTDDLQFLLDASAGVIHVRSASRVGHSDLGTNRRRVERIRAAFAARRPS